MLPNMVMFLLFDLLMSDSCIIGVGHSVLVAGFCLSLYVLNEDQYFCKVTIINIVITTEICTTYMVAC